MAFGFGVRHTRNKPKEPDLIGVYRPNLKTKFLIERDTKSPATNCAIKLCADGRIEFINTETLIIGDRDANLHAVKMTSTNIIWKLEQYEGTWDIAWSYKDVSENGLVSGDGLRLVGGKPPYSIQIYNWQTGVPFYFVQEKN
jgi:hypothetical protein